MIDETQFLAFYADIPHEYISWVIDDLESFYKGPKQYLIGLEYAEGREHMHFVLQFNDKEYTAYVKRVLKGKYKLSGRRNKKGHTGQFGKVSKIRDFEAMCSYTLKDLDYRTNFPVEFIEKVKTKSYPKPDQARDLLDECMEFLNSLPQYSSLDETTYPLKNNDNRIISYQNCLDRENPNNVAIGVINFLRTKKLNITANTIRKYTYWYLAYHTNKTNESIYYMLFPHGI